MPVTPEDLLDAAEVICRGTTEVDCRNAASRSYYSAYHRCVSVAQEAKLLASQERVGHKQLVAILTEGTTSRSLKSLGYLLDVCRKRREQADYAIHDPFERDTAMTALEDSRTILARAATL